MFGKTQFFCRIGIRYLESLWPVSGGIDDCGRGDAKFCVSTGTDFDGVLRVIFCFSAAKTF
jgi:hypothetical protein